MSWPAHLPPIEHYCLYVVDSIQTNGHQLDAWFCHEELTLYITHKFMCSMVSYCVGKIAGKANPLSTYSAFGKIVGGTEC